MQRYYFESDVPSLDEICEKVRQQYHSNVQFEKNSYTWGDVDDYENEEEKKGVEKFEKDLLGISKHPVTIHHCFLRSNDEVIGLQTYNSDWKHININSCTSKTLELYEFTSKILEQYGGKAREITEEEIKQLKRSGHLSLSFFFVKIAVLVVLYTYFNFSFWQLIGIIIIYLIAKQIIETIFAYKRAKKLGWL